MAFVTRLGDKCTGHDACSPMSLITASTNVFINGMGAGRQTDIYEEHGCVVHSSHNDVISDGSSSVFINGLPIARIGDSVNIGGTVMEGSNNVEAGD